MSTTSTREPAGASPAPPAPPTAPRSSEDPSHYGLLGRLGLAVTSHGRFTAVVWLLLIVGLGAFAPRVEAELSGAGWQADGSESVAVRDLAEEHFGGNASHAIQVVVRSDDGPGHRGGRRRGAGRGHPHPARPTAASARSWRPSRARP